MTPQPPAVRALRPLAVAGYFVREDGEFAHLPGDMPIGTICGVSLTVEDARAAYRALSEATPVRTPRQRRWTRLKALVGCWLPHTGGHDGQEA